MSTTDRKLIADHKEVVETIRLYDSIKLINTAGEPVDEYDIEYRLKGYTITPDGRIMVNKNHRIKIKLPFGYPHFHPTVKPLSPIFHPDIDAHAIRIAHCWEKNKSLPDLILHIGNMICGQEYSLDNPFNVEAANYFEKHQRSLPLDSLEQQGKDAPESIDRDPIRLDFLVPFFKVFMGICIIILAGGGILYYFEKLHIDDGRDALAKAQIQMEDQDYRGAQITARKALESLDIFYLLKSSKKNLTTDLNLFLRSETLQKGLSGKIEYNGKFIEIETYHKLELLQQLKQRALKSAEEGDIQSAVEEFEKAIRYANENNLNDILDEIKKDLADVKLQVLVSASVKAHDSKNWAWAIEQHKQVLDYIKKEKKYLKDADDQANKTRHLLLIDQIAHFSRLALEAEEKDDIETALNNYNALINLIGKSDTKGNSTLRDTLVDAMQKAAVLSEKVVIKKHQEWLVDNYKDIFLLHYPTILAATLRSPQAIFVKYNGKNLVYDLSCLEKSSGSVVRLRVYYQYDPDIMEWSTYSGEI